MKWEWHCHLSSGRLVRESRGWVKYPHPLAHQHLLSIADPHIFQSIEYYYGVHYAKDEGFSLSRIWSNGEKSMNSYWTPMAHSSLNTAPKIVYLSLFGRYFTVLQNGYWRHIYFLVGGGEMPGGGQNAPHPLVHPHPPGIIAPPIATL